MRRISSTLLAAHLLLALAACGDDDGGAPPGTDGGVDAGRTDGGGTCPEEDLEVSCDDGCDNDGDTLVDCDDTGCATDPVCTACESGEENTDAACSDGCSNDGDTFVDCADFDCAGTAPCPIAVENSNQLCSDGEDNDGNSFVDCDDNACKGRDVCKFENTNTACSDGVSNDDDELVDCDDPDCQNNPLVFVCGDSPATAEEWPALVNEKCTNGENDEHPADLGDEPNDFVDCGDNACRFNFEATDCHDLLVEGSGGYDGNRLCSDGLDNDKNGAADCADVKCQREGIVVCDGETPVSFDDQEAITAAANAVCSDGESNDDNDFVDCDDFGCELDTWVTVCEAREITDEACSDGVSNNGTEFVDCADFSCQQSPLVTVCAVERSVEQCSDGVDNDGSGQADCDDFACNPRRGAQSPSCRGDRPDAGD